MGVCELPVGLTGLTSEGLSYRKRREDRGRIEIWRAVYNSFDYNLTHLDGATFR